MSLSAKTGWEVQHWMCVRAAREENFGFKCLFVCLFVCLRRPPAARRCLQTVPVRKLFANCLFVGKFCKHQTLKITSGAEQKRKAAESATDVGE